MDPAIPTPEQIRSMPVTSVVTRRWLRLPGFTHSPAAVRALRNVATEAGTFIGTVPSSPSDGRALRNCRAWLARRVGEMRIGTAPEATAE